MIRKISAVQIVEFDADGLIKSVGMTFVSSSGRRSIILQPVTERLLLIHCIPKIIDHSIVIGHNINCCNLSVRVSTQRPRSLVAGRIIERLVEGIGDVSTVFRRQGKLLTIEVIVRS